MNATWIWNNNQNPLDYDPITVANRCIAGKISIIIPWLGYWNSDGTIHYLWNIDDIKNWVVKVKSVNSNLKVLGCISNTSCYFPGQPVIDITDQNIRIKMVNEMVNSVNTLNLDGFNEDIECAHLLDNGFNALLDLWNKMSIAMKNINKISSADIQNWGDYLNVVSKNVNIDYLLPMCYNDGGWTNGKIQNCIHNQLVTSNSPLIIGIGQYQGPSLSDMLSSIDDKLPSEDTTKLRGFAIYEYGTMTQSDWNVWNSWSTKDKYANGITPPPPPQLSSISISPTNPTINIKQTVQLTPSCKDQNDNTIQCPSLSWKSDNPQVATVDNTGKVTGISQGTANITANYGTINSNKSLITVTSIQPPVSKFRVQVSTNTIIISKSSRGQYDADQACKLVCDSLHNM